MPSTFPTVALTGDDADGFVGCVDRVVAGLVFRYRPAQVCVVRIRKWFDHRWLGYSGKGRVFFDTPFIRDPAVALEAFHQDNLTFPPFAPTRVAAEHHWERNADGDYARTTGRFRIHRRRLEHSSANLHRRVGDTVESGLLVWFSSTSGSDQRGSVMVYVVNDGVTIPWFAALHAGADGWSLREVKGLGRAEVQELLEHPPGVGVAVSP